MSKKIDAASTDLTGHFLNNLADQRDRILSLNDDLPQDLRFTEKELYTLKSFPFDAIDTPPDTFIAADRIHCIANCFNDIAV